jgi:hypothetical protein
MTEMEKTNGFGENSFLVLLLPPQIPSKLAWDQTRVFINSNSYILVMFLLYNEKNNVSVLVTFFFYLHGYSISQVELKFYHT